MVSVVTRHPRYSILLGCILLGTFFLLSTPSISSDTLLPNKSLRRILREEDIRYEQTLRDREEMVRKYGPTDSEVDS